MAKEKEVIENQSMYKYAVTLDGKQIDTVLAPTAFASGPIRKQLVEQGSDEHIFVTQTG
tara:strand:+ start:833 stop:1009 length:177 start_codon:yes stop_codon:yes gene_type:complete